MEESRRTRHAARVLLLDERGRILLLHGFDPTLADDPGWWFTPGGGLEEGETAAVAALRELIEETGLRLDALGDPVAERDASFTFEGEDIRQLETYFTATTTSFEVDRSGWTDVEQRSITTTRWWTLAELESTPETIFPENLVTLLHSLHCDPRPHRHPYHPHHP